MTTSQTGRSSLASEREPLRIKLRSSTSADGLDGAWWPQSRDLQAEAADLVDNLTGTDYVNRLLYSRPDWDDSTTATGGVRRIAARRGPVKVGSFPGDDTHQMVLALATGKRLHLQVIASDTDAAEANRQLQAV